MSNKPTAILADIKQRVPWKKGIVIFGILLFIGWLSLTPQGLLGKADAVGYAVCHRIESRSFHVWGRQVPLCARCTGQYLGAVLSLGFLSFFRPRRTGRPPWGIVGILALFAAVYALDGLNSYIHLIPALSRFYLYQPRNLFRVITGTGLGMGMGVLVYPAFNETVWRTTETRPVFQGVKDFSALLLAGGVIDYLVLTENPFFLYPLALISAAGVLILLTMIYTMVLVIVIKKENAYENLYHLSILLVAGFIIALMQIAFLDLMRFQLTGTWSGFHFG